MRNEDSRHAIDEFIELNCRNRSFGSARPSSSAIVSRLGISQCSNYFSVTGLIEELPTVPSQSINARVTEDLSLSFRLQTRHVTIDLEGGT